MTHEHRRLPQRPCLLRGGFLYTAVAGVFSVLSSSGEDKFLHGRLPLPNSWKKLSVAALPG